MVGNEGKRMRRVQRLRGEHRQDLFAEIFAHLRLQGLAHRGWLNDLNAFAGQFLHQFAPKLLLLDHQPVGGGNGVGELFGRRAAIDRQLFDLSLLLPAQASHADHEKLIKVATGNRQETEPLQQGVRWVRRFFQHALIKFQPRQLAVKIARIGWRFLGFQSARTWHGLHEKFPSSTAKARCHGNIAYLRQQKCKM